MEGPLAPWAPHRPAWPADCAERGALAKQVNALYHDLQAAQFDSIHRCRHRIERVFWQTEVAPRLMDAGCCVGIDLCTGTGFVPASLLEALGPTSRIICVDVSEMAVRRARTALRTQAARVAFQVADIEVLPFPDGCADWVSLNAGLHHIPNVSAALSEVDRVLAPGGYFCLGYEPNAAFFTSGFPRRLERAIWHGFWFLSPGRNLDRIRRRLTGGNPPFEMECLSRINAALLAEGTIGEPLSLEQLRRLVDIHTKPEETTIAGFHPRDLIERHFPAYTVELLTFTDYGGEMLRPHPLLRSALDTACGWLCPRKGSLFSGILRKPVVRGCCGPRGE